MAVGDIRHLLAADAEPFRRPGHAEAQRLRTIVTDRQSRTGRVFHRYAFIPLMVIDRIHIAGMNAVEAQDDAPVARDANRPEPRQIALRGMQPVSGQVHAGASGRRS